MKLAVMKWIAVLMFLFPLAVSASTTGSSITVITQEEIKDRNTPFVLDLLRTVPGIQVVQYGSPGKPALVYLRGASSTQPLILIDGVPIIDSLGFVDLGTLSTTGIERIEITRGAQSALYGSEAMAGVINIITGRRAPLLSGQIEAGSDHTKSGNIQAGVGSDKNNLSLYYGRYDTDGEISNDDFRNTTKGIDAHAEIIAGTNIGWIYRSTKSNIGTLLPAHTTFPFLPPSLHFESTSDLLLLPLTQRITGWWDVNFRYSRFKQQLQFPDYSFSAIHSKTKITELQSQWKTPQGDTLLAAYEHAVETLDDQPLEFLLRGTDFITDSAYTELQIARFTGWNFGAAFRHDRNDTYGSENSSRITLSYDASRGIRVHAAAGSGFRAPRPIELLAASGYPQLQPEHVKSFDVGASYEVIPRRFYGSATVFQHRYEDVIEFDFGTFKLQNLDKHKVSGLELEAEYQPLETLTLLASYTFLHSPDSAESLLHQAKNSGSLNIGYHRNKIRANFNWNFIGSRTDSRLIAPHLIQNDSYHRADLGLGYDVIAPVQIYVRITNLFDRRYQEAFRFPSPDRAIFAGLNFQY